MIIQLLPEQIPGFWPDIKESIQAAAPPIFHETPEKMNNILMSMLIGKMQVWVLANQEEEATIVKSVIVTSIVSDSCSNTRMFLFYSGYSANPVSQKLWAESIDEFRKIAKGLDCDLMGFYSELPYMTEQARKTGASIENFAFWKLED